MTQADRQRFLNQQALQKNGWSFQGMGSINAPSLAYQQSNGSGNAYESSQFAGPITPPADFPILSDKSHSLMKTIVNDIKAFIAEHKNIIYVVVLVLIVDHVFLGGRLKDRVKALAEKFLGSVEKKLDGHIDAPKPPTP